MITALLTLACATAPELSLPAVELPDGITQADHTEVAPGVFLLTEAIASGLATYGGPNPPEAPEAAPVDPTSASSKSARYCNESASASYTDSTTSGDWFGGTGDPTWDVTAQSASYFAWVGGGSPPVNYDSVYLEVSATTPTDVDYIYAYGYVYVGATYVGYVTATGTSTDSAMSTGTIYTDCGGAPVLDISVRGYFYGSDYSGSGDYITVSKSVDVPVTCCP